jgi:hypothetical protein
VKFRFEADEVDGQDRHDPKVSSFAIARHSGACSRDRHRAAASVIALREAQKVRVLSGSEWNPASSLVIRGLIYAWIGGFISLAILGRILVTAFHEFE